MQRIIKLTKYRNLGLEEPATLILNHSIKRDEIGDLVILIGPNNSGKSNVLDALTSIANGQLSNRDVTTLSFENADRIPEISFGIRGDNDESIYYNLVLNKEPSVVANIKKEKIPLPTREELLVDARTAYELAMGRAMGIPFTNELIQKLESTNTRVDQALADRVINDIDRIEQAYMNRYGRPSNLGSILPPNSYWIKVRQARQASNINYANDWCKEKYGIPFMPAIITYKERQLSANDLKISPDNIGNSLFFQSLLATIGVNPEKITNAYQQYRSFGNIATLNKINKEVNSKIAKLNIQFNRMYFAEKDQYKFSVNLSENSISFGMARGKDEDPIMLEHQSTGFRWFFNLFFNFLSSTELKPGDIVIMDEPATNLHPKGQKELRRFIKTFARTSGLTFVIATHSPFLIDSDNYDELRVISMENNRSKIDNLFSAANANDPDSLLPIKESLTIEQNILYSLKTEIVWVEGITDYNYLTMFKNLLNIEDVAFIPFNGVGKTDDEQMAILKRLKSIEFHRFNLLCDGDKAGKKMKELCKGTCFEHMLLVSDLSTEQKKFREIEDLFSPEDRKKYGLPHKSGSASHLMKMNCKLTDFTEETIENFRSLFNELKY